MKRNEKEERRSLRELLATPVGKKVLRITGWTLTALAAVYLIVLALVVLLQPADRAFTRTEEWITIGLLALPAVIILAIGLIRFLRRKQRKSKV